MPRLSRGHRIDHDTVWRIRYIGRPVPGTRLDLYPSSKPEAYCLWQSKFQKTLRATATTQASSSSPSNTIAPAHLAPSYADASQPSPAAGKFPVAPA